MRINLVTPFAEKNAVKALGARWDSVKKCWYIVDVADLSPFTRWIPNLDAAMDGSGGNSLLTKPASNQPAPVNVPVKSDAGVADCDCNVLPWEDCEHTARV
jgi:hypothetical protein